jgi:hypothetical protein
MGVTGDPLSALLGDAGGLGCLASNDVQCRSSLFMSSKSKEIKVFLVIFVVVVIFKH